MQDNQFIDVPLSKMLEALRLELRLAQNERDDRIPLEVQDIELELDMGVSVNANGAIQFSVLSFGAARENRSVQRFKIRLTAKDPKTGGPLSIDSGPRKF